MPQRPPQGRGSGGRVTPSSKKPASTPPQRGGRAQPGRTEPKGKARVLQASKPARTKKGPTRTPASPPDQVEAVDDGVGTEPGPDHEADADTGRSSAASSVASGWRALLAPKSAPGVPAAERVRPWWGMGDVAMWGAIAYIVVPLLLSIGIIALLVNLGYDLNWPVGDGARLGEASRQFVAGEPVHLTRSTADMPLWLYQFAFTVPLWVGFVAGPIWVAYRKGLGYVRDWKVRMKAIDIPIGLGVGVAAQLVLVPVLYWLIFLVVPDEDVSSTARNITDRADSPGMIVFLLVAVGILTPIIEELFFRGLCHQAFKKRLGRWWGATATSALFAITHAELILFPPLFLFAFALSWLVDRFDRIGPAIWGHIGFNTVTAVSLAWGLGIG